MPDNKIKLEEKDFSFVCPLKTKDMKEVEGGYHCDSCDKKVYDVSNMNKYEYSKLLEKNDNVCVSFKTVAAASLALSLTACATEKSKPVLLGKIVPSRTCTVPKKSVDTNASKKPFKINEDNRTVEIAGMPAYNPYKYKKDK